MMKDDDTLANERVAMTTAGAPYVSFDRKEYDITDKGCQLCLCLTCPLHFLPLVPGAMGNKRMIMDGDEVVVEVECPCYSVNTRRPYGELGSVDKVKYCGCSGVSSNLTKSMPIFIGWGCDDVGVTEIVDELKKRMKARGDTGQIRRTEQALKEVQELRYEMTEMRQDMKALLTHFNVVVPIPSPSEQMVR